jgi:transposase
VTTLEEVVGAIEAKHGRAQRIWVLDRGMISEEKLNFLRKGDRPYIVGAPKSALKGFQKELSEKSWTEVREGLEVKLCAGPEGQETFILCRSADRREKEKAMHERFAQRIETDLQRLAGRLKRARQRADGPQVHQQIGRILGRNSRAAGLFQIRLKESRKQASGVRLVWKRRSEWSDWASLSEGCYLLRSNILDWTPEALWRLYIQLTQAEAAFRIQKSELRMRPVWHQRADRVEAHLLVCFLAYVLWKTLERWQSQAGLGHSPRTLLHELGRIQSVDVVAPTTDGRELRLRCVVRPDKAQNDLLARLGLTLPKRLRPLNLVAKM